jgi:hypothetical protein
MTRPAQRAATLCRECDTCTIEVASIPGEHRPEEGWVLPYGKVRWFSGPRRFEASTLFPFIERDRNGRRTEVLFDPGFTFSIAGARCRAKRSPQCWLAQLFLGQRTAA